MIFYFRMMMFNRGRCAMDGLNRANWRSSRADCSEPFVFAELKCPPWLFSLDLNDLHCPSTTDLDWLRKRREGWVLLRFSALYPVGPFYMSVVHLNPSLRNQKKKKKILPLFEETKKNHFVSLTFVSMFLFFNSGVCLFYKNRIVCLM